MGNRLHNITNHPLREVYTYEAHDINALFVGIDDTTLIERAKLACSEISLSLQFTESERENNRIARMLGREPAEHLLIKREHGLVKILSASINDEKGAEHVKKIEARLREITAEYEKQSGHKLREVTVHNG